jgi:hypothetical protein
MIKTTALYQLPGYKTLELVVISEPISSSDNYDPTSISGSSNPVMAEERTHSRAREQRPSRIPDKIWMWMWMWMWMRMTKRKSDTWMSRRMTYRMQQI